MNPTPAIRGSDGRPRSCVLWLIPTSIALDEQSQGPSLLQGHIPAGMASQVSLQRAAVAPKAALPENRRTQLAEGMLVVVTTVVVVVVVAAGESLHQRAPTFATQVCCPIG